MAFLQIITDNILPLLIFVAIGYFMDRRFRLDVNSLTKLTFYIILPCFNLCHINAVKNETGKNDVKGQFGQRIDVEPETPVHEVADSHKD